MERGRDGGGATLQPHAKGVPSSNGHVLFASHAYMECGHVAQHFGLPNSDSIRHHGFDSGRMMKTSITRTSVARRVREGGGRRESLSERQCAEDLSMQDVLPEGGVIRKLWIGETEK